MPEDYIEYFREKGVTAVVRLNKKMYESGRCATIPPTTPSYHACYQCPACPRLPYLAAEAAMKPSLTAYHGSAQPPPTRSFEKSACPALPKPADPATSKRHFPTCLPCCRFTQYGVKHYEMYFPDGTCPSEPIMYRFLDTVEKEPGALAVSVHPSCLSPCTCCAVPLRDGL